MSRFNLGLGVAVLSLGSWACSSGGSGTTTTGGTNGGGQCVVPAQVASDLSLGLECATWAVTSNVKVGSASSPTLTIRAGVKLAFAAGTSLDVGNGQPGGLQILGTSASHVVFSSAASSPGPGDWAGLQISSSARSDTSLSYLDVSYAGGAQSLAQQAAIVVDGSGSTGAAVTPTMTGISITSTKGHGFCFQGNHAGPGPGSAQLSVTGWDSAGTGHFFPYVVDPDAAGLLPATLKAMPTSPSAVVSLQNYQKKDIVDVSQTWAALPLPYLLGMDGTTDGLTIGSSASDAILTVAAPNTFKFTHGYGITISDDPGSGNMRGALVANGSGGSAITLTSASTTPAAGDWGGFQFKFGPSGATDSSLTYCDIQYAGGTYNLDTYYGAIVMTGDAPAHICNLTGPAIANCTFTQIPSGESAIVASQVAGSQTSDYAAQNTFPAGTTPVVAVPCS